MALNLIRPAIGSESLVAATAHGLEPRVVSGSSGLPAGFPASLDTQLSWTGKQFNNDESYVYRLSVDEIAEAESALQYFKCECPQSRQAHMYLHLFSHLAPITVIYHGSDEFESKVASCLLIFVSLMSLVFLIF